MEFEEDIVVETDELKEMLNHQVQSVESELGQVYYAILDVMGEFNE